MITKGGPGEAASLFFNAGGETATKQTELIVDVVKVIANVLQIYGHRHLRRVEKPREAGRKA
jgi:hypothetical protein